MITFVFSHHCVVRFFALPASVSLSGVSGETNFLGNILASIQKTTLGLC
jgi:hypothetical protein